MVEPLRHRQTKEAATDMFSLQPPRHISTLPETEVPRRPRFGRDRVESRHEADIANRSFVTDTVEKAGCPLGVVPLGCFEAALLG